MQISLAAVRRWLTVRASAVTNEEVTVAIQNMMVPWTPVAVLEMGDKWIIWVTFWL